MLVRDKRAFFYTGHEKHFLLIRVNTEITTEIIAVIAVITDNGFSEKSFIIICKYLDSSFAIIKMFNNLYFYDRSCPPQRPPRGILKVIVLTNSSTNS